MLKQVYDVDANGFLIDIYVASVNEDGNILDEDKRHMVKVDYPPLFKPKWNGEEWIEGETAEEKAEREAAQQLETFLPSSEEIANAELEIKIITLLTEMGLTT